MDNVAIVVGDLDAAVAFFTALGMSWKAGCRSKEAGREGFVGPTICEARSR